MKNELDTTDKGRFLEQFSGLRPDLFFPESWDDKQKAEAMELISPRRTKTAMFASIPMRCEAEKCIYADTCPLQQQNIAPKGFPCPIEMQIVNQFMQDYIFELGVNPDNLTEVSMIRDLVDQEVQYLRKTRLLAKEHFIQENVVGIDSEGEVVMKKELHLAVELEDKLLKRKKDLRNQLLATREARAKVGQSQLDSSETIANIMETVRQLDAAKEAAMRKRLGTLYQDDYIQDADIVVEPESKDDESEAE